MTVTETDAPAAQGNADAPALEPPPPATGLAALLGSSDHKTIGTLWIGTSLLYLAALGVTGVLLGIERIDLDELTIFSDASFGPVLGFHEVAGPFLVVLPLLLGIATVVVPLQVGARSLAFPRASAVAYWTFLLASVVIVASTIADGGPLGTDADAVALFLAGFIAVLAALVVAAVSVATTGLGLRASGMALHRAPLFTWANIVSAAIVVLTLPVLAAISLLAYVDLRYGPTFLGTTDGIWAHLQWSWRQPTIYVVAIAVLGIIADIVPVAARTRITRHRVGMGVIGAFGILAFGAWAIPGFSIDGTTTPLAYVNEVPFVVFSIVVLVPLLGLVGLIADTVRRGTPQLVSPLLWAVGALLMLLAGAATGALVSIDPLDLFGTSAEQAQTHYVLGAAVLGGIAGLVYWAPKIVGQQLADVPSSLLALGGLAGVVLASMPDLAAGFLDEADDQSTIEALNTVSAVGELILLAVSLGVIGLIVAAAASKKPAEADPWGGHTLEWVADELPPVTSEAPIYDARHRAGEADS